MLNKWLPLNINTMSKKKEHESFQEHQPASFWEGRTSVVSNLQERVAHHTLHVVARFFQNQKLFLSHTLESQQNKPNPKNLQTHMQYNEREREKKNI